MAIQFATAALIMAAAALSAVFTMALIFKKRLMGLEHKLEALRAEGSG